MSSVEKSPPRNSSGNIVRLIISILVVALAIWVFMHRQYLIDQVSFRTYTPNSEVAAMADETSMTSEGKFYFYASRPELSDRDSFNENCQLRGEQTVVLGCYTMQRIYIFDVEDERLDGIEEVTAAHEMLHAAYDRLSTSERDRINQLIEEEAENITNERILALIKVYEETEPGERLNELHSILPTEVEQLSAELESYYRQYFDDRQIVVQLSQDYESVFSDLQSRQAEIAAELESLAEAVRQRTAAYNQDIAELNAAVRQFNQRAENGEFESQSEFDSERNALLAEQQSLQTERNEIDDLVAEYEALRAELIAINSEAKELNENLDSSLEPVPAF